MHLSLSGFAPLSFGGYGKARFATISQRVREIREAVEGRRAIARMNGHMLSDIGLSHGEALHEVNRKPWDIKPVVCRNR